MIRFSGRVILLDIEGTTSSISYVYDVLFPYARQQLSDFLRRHWESPEVARSCDLLAADLGRPSFDAWRQEVLGPQSDQTAAQQRLVAEEVGRLMDSDLKATGLKDLQGLIWKEGYASGHLQSHVFPDVPPALSRWVQAGLQLRIYSSGSVSAQKVFFAHTQAGDLLRFLSGHYDTVTGPKREAASYQAIAGDANVLPGEVLFLSDVTAELDAAEAAALQTALVVRPGNTPVEPNHGHPAIESFDQIEVHSG